MQGHGMYYEQQHDQQHEQLFKYKHNSSGSFRMNVPLHISAQNSTRRIEGIISLDVSETAVERETLSLSVTDPKNPLFLFCADINKSDYESLCQKQDIKVPFSEFPFNLRSLLQKCASDTHTKFYCELLCSEGTTSVCYLKVVETNAFKNISHITLSVVPGDTARVNVYVVDCLKEEQSKVFALSQQQQEKDALITRLKNDLFGATAALERVEKESKEKAQKNKETTKRKTETEIEQIKQSLTHSHKQELDTVVRSFEEQITQLKSALAQKEEERLTYTQTNTQQHNELLGKDKQISQYELQLERVQTQLDRAKSAAKASEDKLAQTQTQLHALERSHSSTNTLCKEKETQLKRTTKELKEMRTQMSTLQSENTRKEQTVRSLEEQTHRLSHTMSLCYDEIAKGNGIITQLKKENKSLRECVSERDEVVVHMQTIIEQNTNENDSLSKKQQSLESALSLFEQQVKEQNKQIEILKDEIQRKEVELKAAKEFSSILSNRILSLEKKKKRKPLNTNTNTRTNANAQQTNEFLFVAKNAEKRNDQIKPMFKVNGHKRGNTNTNPQTNTQTQIPQHISHNVSLYS
eukprot:m.73632 g.73632  ORF g.73632 m.73632 type:complete len:581 (+) comp11777_c0_seq1:1752-3494(+)